MNLGNFHSSVTTERATHTRISGLGKGLKAQSAIEYLMTYGWMLLVVAVVGGAIFATVQNESPESVSGFLGSDVIIDDFGVTGSDELGLNVRNGAGDEVVISEVNVSDPDSGEWVFKEFTSDSKISVGSEKVFQIPNVTRGDGSNSLDVEIVYDSGGLSNLSQSGAISGDLELTDSEVEFLGGPDDSSESGSDTVSISGAPSFSTAPSGAENEDSWVPVAPDSGTSQGFNYFFDESSDEEYFNVSEGFYVMKYEAKAYDTSSGSFKGDGGSSNNWADTDVEPRSVAANKPWRKISFSDSSYYDAVEACESLSNENYDVHLVTNREWMTVARQVEQTDSNWVDTSDGSDANVGDSGAGIYRGNSGASTELDVDLSDKPNAAGDGGEEQRTHELANGEVVWDYSGNVRQWVDIEEDGSALGDNDNEDWRVTDSGDNQYWDEISGFRNGFSRNSGSESGNDLKRELGPIDDSWGQSEGTGYLYDDYTEPRAALRGGRWGYGDYAGVFYAYSTSPGSTSSFSGFRCSAVPVS